MKPSDILLLRELGFLKASGVVATILFLTFLAAIASGLGKKVVEAVGWSDSTVAKPVRSMTLDEWFEKHSGG